VFEDYKYENLLPLTYVKPVFELKLGFDSILDKLLSYFSYPVVLVVRDYLVKVELERRSHCQVNSLGDADELLLVNGRLIPRGSSINLIAELMGKHDSFILTDVNGDVAAAKIGSEHVSGLRSVVEENPLGLRDFLIKLKSDLEVFESRDIDLIGYLWDLVDLNSEFLRLDFKRKVGSPGIYCSIDSRTVIYGSYGDMYISSNVEIEGNVNIDARRGPVYIDDGVTVYGPARIEGPCYIGRDSLILSGARIRGGSSIGEVCRVGGEVEESILYGYVNMYHEGFIGHSYISEWVNLGALTVTSDLKNTYGIVKVKGVSSGRIKVGCFMADHVKTAIGCRIWTGKCIGVASHLYGVVYEDVPSFTIYAKSIGLGAYELKLESAIETMKRVYSRRGRVPSECEIELIRKIFELTERERADAGVVKGEFRVP